MDWPNKQSCMGFKWFQHFAPPRCLFPWPTAPTDDQCRAAFQTWVTHLGAAWIEAAWTRPSGSKDSLENASPCPMSMFRWSWRPGSICEENRWRMRSSLCMGSHELKAFNVWNWGRISTEALHNLEWLCQQLCRPWLLGPVSTNLGCTSPSTSARQALTFGSRFNQTLDGVTLPAGLQALTFGRNFNRSLDGVTLPAGLQALTFGRIQPQLGWRNSASRSASLDFREVQPQLGWRNSASRSASLDFRQKLQPQLGWRNSASRSASLDFRQKLQPQLGWRNSASRSANLCFRGKLQPQLGWPNSASRSANVDYWQI